MRLSAVVATEAAKVEATQVDLDEFAAAIDPLFPSSAKAVAVAVSGGADSMALALLVQKWSRGRGVTVTALTVDHQLRTESASEAARVAEWMAARGLNHVCLKWDEGQRHSARESSAQAAAREARYRLLTAWCSDHGVNVLAIAHHADDQVETFLMRLTRGSGLAGLAGIAERTDINGVSVVRPLLAFPKSRLEATCKAVNQPWVSDPSNDDDGYARTRFRKARQFLSDEGLSDARLLATVGHLRRAQDAIDAAVSAIARTGLSRDRFGVYTLNASVLQDVPSEVALRLVARILAAAAGDSYGPRFESLERLLAQLTKSEDAKATLGGCVVARSGETVRFIREAAAISDEQSISVGGEVNWDRRFRIRWCAGPSDWPREGYRVSRFTNDHWLALKSRDASRVLDNVPNEVRRTLPVILKDSRVVGAPHTPDSTLGIIEVSWCGGDTFAQM